MARPVLACLHHLERPSLGLAEAPLRAAGLELDERRVTEGDPLPELGDVAGIVSFGGAQSVRGIDSEPALEAEAALLREAVEREVPVLGICLGGQLLAHALGGEVGRLERRTVAWWELEPAAAAEGDPVLGALGAPVLALHFNEDGFSLPPGAVELLGRGGASVEGFRAGRAAWGVQFHPEADGPLLEDWYVNYRPWIDQAGVDPEELRAAGERCLPRQAEQADALFRAFARVVLDDAARR
ncbi:MAG: type 1 glutamine amidotransferase [Actinomycetota bacterium]|nr:type 1 glutamine amidotransferase [Actinomycetota bacterium]